MKEQDLIELGFERTDVTAEESGYGYDWHYYAHDLGRGYSLLISNDSKEAENEGEWYVDFFFDDENIRFTSKEDTQQFIQLVKRNTIKL